MMMTSLILSKYKLHSIPPDKTKMLPVTYFVWQCVQAFHFQSTCGVQTALSWEFSQPLLKSLSSEILSLLASILHPLKSLSKMQYGVDHILRHYPLLKRQFRIFLKYFSKWRPRERGVLFIAATIKKANVMVGTWRDTVSWKKVVFIWILNIPQKKYFTMWETRFVFLK